MKTYLAHPQFFGPSSYHLNSNCIEKLLNVYVDICNKQEQPLNDCDATIDWSSVCDKQSNLVPKILEEDFRNKLRQRLPLPNIIASTSLLHIRRNTWDE